MKKVLYYFFAVFLITNLNAQPQQEQMVQDLGIIKHLLDVSYAPAEWKKSHLGWDVNAEYQQAKNEILANPHLSLKQYHKILRKFLASTQDYHVKVRFYSTEEATLPFRVRTVDNRTFIDWINTKKMQKQFYGIKPGDELIEFDGRPVQAVLAEIRNEIGFSSNEQTDQGLIDEALTERLGSKGDVVPKGSVMITVKSVEDALERTFQLMWEYLPERIKPPSNFSQHLSILMPKQKENTKSLDQDRSIGARYSFVPLLGLPTWAPEDSNRDDDDPFWNAYIYQNEEGRSIGYLRIPNYDGGEDELDKLGKILSHMQNNTEALVIDQVNNGGGYSDFLYDVASMLTTKPLTTPRHRVKIAQDDVFYALKRLDYIKLKDIDLIEIVNRKGDEDYQKLLFEQIFWEFMVQEWNDGRTMTNPIHILGVDQINPSAIVNYTKPILFLINELDFSCADFMPAILHDNKRAVLFGTQTAGAGGWVKKQTFPNVHGIALVKYTASLAERDDFQKIENLGVKPDIEYKIGVEDVQNRYAYYGKAINEAITKMLPPKAEEVHNSQMGE